VGDTQHFHPIGSVATVQVLSQTEVADVQRVRGYTKPTGIYLAVNVPRRAWQNGNEETFEEAPAAIIEGLIAEGLLAGATFVQATDENRLFSDAVDLTVSYDPPGADTLPFTTIVRIPMTALASRAAYTLYAETPPHVRPIVTAYNRLVETAGGPATDKV
jgi:hypothetical protein